MQYRRRQYRWRQYRWRQYRWRRDSAGWAGAAGIARITGHAQFG